MTVPQSNPQSVDRFDAAMNDLQHALSRELAGEAARPRAGPPTARPAVAEAPAPVAKWGLPNTPVTPPLELLVDCAAEAHALQRAVEALCEAVTGEVPATRCRAAVALPAALLPAVGQLAHEIERTHAEIGQLVADLRGRL